VAADARAGDDGIDARFTDGGRVVGLDPAVDLEEYGRVDPIDQLAGRSLSTTLRH